MDILQPFPQQWLRIISQLNEINNNSNSDSQINKITELQKNLSIKINEAEKENLVITDINDPNFIESQLAMIDRKNKALLQLETGSLSPLKKPTSKVHHNLSIDVQNMLAKS